MREQNQPREQELGNSGKEPDAAKQDRAAHMVRYVITDRTGTRTAQIAEHAQIRRKEQQGPEPGTDMQRLIVKAGHTGQKERDGFEANKLLHAFVWISTAFNAQYYAMRKILILALLLAAANLLNAQTEWSITDVNALNRQRIRTDMTGMKVLGTWGAVNTIAGISGAIAADNKEWRHFHQMNAVWGVVNMSIAGLGYLGAHRERNRELSADRALHRYESTKRLYLLNAGLDGLYIGTGAFLLSHSRNSDNPEMYRGFGKSLLLQGIGLLAFDATMFCAHQHQDKRWYKLLQGVSFSGTGIGIRYALN